MSIEKKYPLYADIIVDVSSSKLDRPFVYGVKEEDLQNIYIGSTVRVPFNRRSINGFVIAMSEFPPFLPLKVKEIKAVEKVLAPESFWDKEMLELSRWMESYYGCTYLDALKSLIPAPVRVKEDGTLPKQPKKKMVLLKDHVSIDLAALKKKAPAQGAMIEYLMNQKGAVSSSEALKKTALSAGVISNLEKKGLIEVFHHSPSSRYSHSHPVKLSAVPELTLDQKIVMENLLEHYKEDRYHIALLYGITGSGKTEIYLRLVQEALNEGKEALVLIPEISLTPQTIARFRERLGEDIAVLHSRLSGLERRIMWWNIRHKKVRVVLGARSAVFAPLENIGVIIVDEEHDSSYKQESEPRYNAKQAAMIRAKKHKALVVLGSATPSMESYYHALNNKYSLHKLPKRVGESVLPIIEIIDLKKDMGKGKNQMLGDTLRREMYEVLGRGEQMILFLNRRGYSSFLLCRDCGRVIRCPYCDVTLTYHKSNYMLKCHYCDYQRKAPDLCPFCNRYNLLTPSPGIQKIQQELEEIFPSVKYIRMDKDTTGGRDAHEDIIGRFARGEAQILLGTQMIAKGHDFPGVTLVGVVMADVSLYIPDFHSIEGTFQLLTQVSGRAGRREFQGKVIIQTYNPKTPVLKAVKEQDYHSFYLWEEENRRRLNFPPFSHIINLLFQGKSSDKIRDYAVQFSNLLRHDKFKEFFIAVLGPAPCPISRIKSRYRWHITIKGAHPQKMIAVIKALRKKIPEPSGISFNIDTDPLSLM